ncbi:MICOS complex subunit MIC25 [Diprion similis]|uniref:MICOS complex subunit MIC25 n=1 Tax=Diprion similis TaxID=362088 RepID=UPI001EF85A7D|nr:MICOS complex subunit MIC25 [Diprion similis]
MGSSQSARKLTISNDEVVGVIQVSDAVVQRLQGVEDEIGSKDVRDAQPSNLMSLPSGVPILPGQGAPSNGVAVYHYPEYTISALEIQQQKEEELKSQDQYWQRRLQNLERNHEKIDTIMAIEYKKAVNEFTDGKNAPSTKMPRPPCIENSTEVLKCYQENPKEILKCSTLVEEFSNCVDQRRAKIIAARC